MLLVAVDGLGLGIDCKTRPTLVKERLRLDPGAAPEVDDQPTRAFAAIDQLNGAKKPLVLAAIGGGIVEL